MPNTVYENFVLENKAEDILKTKLDLMQFATADDSLTETAGMKKIINTYTATGAVEELAQGEGNTEAISVSYQPKEYVVGTTQGRFIYFDEEAMKDPFAIDTGINGLADIMTNDFTTKAINAMDDATIQSEVSSWDFDAIADALALYPYENEDGLFLLINPKMKAEFRKNLKDQLSYVEAFVRTGYIGSVCGVPVYESKAVPNGVAYLGNREAVKVLIKKGIESEQERDANTRKNTVYLRKVALVVLHDATRMIKLGTASDVDLTAAYATNAISGAAATGAVVSVYKAGVLVGSAVAASDTYSVSVTGATAGDKYHIVCKEEGKLNQFADVTIA